MDRQARLVLFFNEATHGKRPVHSLEDSRRFLEGACQLEAVRAAQSLVNPKGLVALTTAARCDLSDRGLRGVLALVGRLSDPDVQSLGGGQMLTKIIMAIIDPPTVWYDMLAAARATHPNRLTDVSLEALAWLAVYLVKISFEDSTIEESFASDVETWFKDSNWKEGDPALTPKFHSHWRKLREMLQMRDTGGLLSADGVTPGGRHDNDFADFRQIVTMPTAAELQCTEPPFYRRWVEVQAVDAPERPRAHLDNMYRLLREDMLAEIRQELQTAFSGKRKGQKRLALADLILNDVVGPRDRDRRWPKCSLVVRPRKGLERIQGLDASKRKAFLQKQPGYLKHQSFAALCRGTDVVAFGSLIRDEDLLCSEEPAVGFMPADSSAFSRALAAFADSGTLRLLVVDAPVFAYEPVLARLKAMPELPLAQALLDSDHPADLTPASDDLVPVVDKFKAILMSNPSVVRIQAGIKAFDLDKSQFTSLSNALGKPVSIIQGPPGTGKSLIGAIVARHFLDAKDIKILVLSFKNHAIDDFLRHLTDVGIPKSDMVRLGGSMSPDMREISLDNLKRSGNRKGVPWAEVNSMRQALVSMREDLESAVKELFSSGNSLFQILDWLEFSDEYADFLQAFSIPEDDDGFRLAGKKKRVMTREYLIERWIVGNDAGFLKEQMRPHRAWMLPWPERQQLMSTWTRVLQLEQSAGIAALAARCNKLQEVTSALTAEDERVVVRSKRVVACTTTAASKYTELIEAAKPDVVLVEEAAEILEAHVLAALGPSVKRLVMIGDHKQLRPRINNFALSVQKGDGFDLDRSLFERLVRCGHEYTTLMEQHRSPPETTNLLRLLTYPDLRDAPKTLTRPPVRGLQQRFVFMNHEHAEEVHESVIDRDASSPGSRQNRFEAEMVLALVRYLAQQGYSTSDMVVLTPYLGQLYLLSDILKHETDPWLADLDNHDLRRAGLITDAAAKAGKNPLRISTIDNYQGEQSDIVIVSLTRSNPQGNIGFLSQPERLTVLMSRHRHGLFILGNMATFMTSRTGGEMWKRFFGHLRDHEFLHDGIPVACEQHPDRQAVLMEPNHFIEKCPDGGCSEVCDAPLSCGRHTCRRRCHRLADHSQTPCDVKFDQTCNRGHKTKVTCTTASDACRDCMHEDEKTRRRAERMLQAEEDRLRRMENYRAQMKAVEDDIDCEQRELQYAREAEDQLRALKARQEDLASLKEASRRQKEMRKKKEERDKKKEEVDKKKEETKAKSPSTSVPATPNLPISSAAAEWEHMKTADNFKIPALDDLMGMIGLEEVKQEFLAIKTRIDLLMRQNLDPSKERLGCTFLGNPGTGKTTVARIYSKLLPTMGAISGSGFVETTGAKLASGGAPKAQKMIDDLLEKGGGVVFIDEAYQLTSGNNPGGGAVLDFLLAEVENLRGSIVFLLAGYDKEMESFFSHNPGLPSRFPTTLKFADYTDDELLCILQRHITSKYNGTMKLEDGLDGLYARIVSRRIGRGRGKPGFGNARAVENAVHSISNRLAHRVRGERRAGGTPDELCFTKEDLIGPEPGGTLQRSKAWKQLQDMAGLDAVKQEIKVLMDTLHANYRRELDEKPLVEYSLNRVLVGNPGTGKTTVAKIYGQILVELGMLSNGEVVVKNPSDFVGAVLGESEKLTKGILASTVGKVLVLDEAYGLYDGGSNPYKTAVIDTIVAEVQSVPGDDRCVLLLGYRDNMEAMFQNVNPGLARRFPMSAAFEFEDFDDAALLTIFNYKLKARGFSATDAAKSAAIAVLSRARNRPNFGNAGEIDILLAEAQRRHQKRQAPTSTLEAADIDPEHDRAERTDTNVAMLFAGEVGREHVIATLTRYQDHVRTCKRLGLDPKEDIPFGFLFRGPPGTGKTTTAKKIGKVFYDMGFLADATVVECSTTALIGEYVGQTAPKVLQQMDKALGRVLFIDEAYRLNDGMFGREALDEIVDCLTKDRYAKKLVVVLAGYDDEINQLLRANPGLSSRFPETLDFANLLPADCWNLMQAQLRRHKLKVDAGGRATADLRAMDYVDPELEGAILACFGQLARVEGWGNARDVKTLASGVFRRVVNNSKGNTVVLELRFIMDELDGMLKERLGRASAGVPHLSSLPMKFREPPTRQPPSHNTATTTAVATEAAPPEAEVEAPQLELISDSDSEPEAMHIRQTAHAKRDAGVSDQVWEQLQQDIEAQRRKDEEYKALKKRARQASAGARDEIIKQLIEEKKRREEEARKQALLMTMGRCPAGYSWTRQAGGWRCAGGSHTIGEAEMEKLGGGGS